MCYLTQDDAEYYSAIKKNEFMKFLAKWMDLEANNQSLLHFT
jgi:hypothetical protein